MGGDNIHGTDVVKELFDLFLCEVLCGVRDIFSGADRF